MLSSNPVINFLLNFLTIRGNFDWSVVANNLFSDAILRGVIITIVLSVISQFIGVVIGLLLYFLRRARLLPMRLIGRAYVWFFRGTPLAVQVLAFFTLFGVIGLGRQLKAIDIFTPLGFQDVYLDSFVAACLALSLNEGAYMSEIIRAGIDSIEVGQLEAARSLGMRYGLAMRRIVLPQAMRVIIPPLGNEFNNMLKSSSLATFAALYELFGTAQLEGARTFNFLEYLFIASVWYLALTTIWGFIQVAIERKFNAANIEPALRERPSWVQRIFWRRRSTQSAPPPEVVIPALGDRR